MPRCEREKEPELALEIADRTRRHRYLSSLPFGGRLLALRWVLEGPPELLNEQSLAQRQDLLAKFARYQELDAAAKKLSAELAAKPVVEETPEARHEQARRLAELGGLGEAQEVILREIAVRREPAELIFPPLRKTKDLQQSLPPGHALLAFFATSNDNLYGFLFSRDKYAMWPIASPALVRPASERDAPRHGQYRPQSSAHPARPWPRKLEKVGGQNSRAVVREVDRRFERPSSTN